MGVEREVGVMFAKDEDEADGRVPSWVRMWVGGVKVDKAARRFRFQLPFICCHSLSASKRELHGP